MRRPRALALCLLLLLAGCAETGSAGFEPISPRALNLVPMRENDSLFLVRLAMFAHPLVNEQRTAYPEDRRQVELFSFSDGMVLVQHSLPGTKIAAATVRDIRDRVAVEGFRRGIPGHDILNEVIAEQRVPHEAYPGDGWLITFATSRSGMACSAGTSFFSVRGIRDSMGLAYDTILTAFFCHVGSEAPADLRNLFRQLRMRAP